MRRKCYTAGVAAIAALSAGAGLAGAYAGVQRFEFDVYLDERRIGTHEYTISSTAPGEARVRSEADFDVRFLAIPVYRYEHRNTEVWRGDCLVSVEATTRTNGKHMAVSGERTDSGFTIAGRAEALPDCVRSFAYWDPALLEQERLLNPQTGEFVTVRIERTVADPGADAAIVYRIEAGDRRIAVWYSTTQQWLGLEAVVKGGRVLRYVRS